MPSWLGFLSDFQVMMDLQSFTVSETKEHAAGQLPIRQEDKELPYFTVMLPW
jgi:hypothetical protein